jgi:hypothetical protein
MSVLNFIKENRVLVAGLVLPLLLIGMMAIAKNLPASMAPAPEYKVLYASFVWGSSEKISFKVDENGKLTASVTANQNLNGTQSPKTILYLYNPKTQFNESIDVTLDADKKPTSFGKFGDLKLTNTQPSPDGYSFESYYNRNYSLLTDIFAYRSYNGGPVLTKKGVVHQIPMPNPYYGSPEFIGWVIEGDTK